MIKTNAIFHRKMIEIEAQPCVIEAIELMNQEQYDSFSRNMLADRDFIRDRKKDMYVDENGTMHCLLVINEDSGDGIVIDSSGYDYYANRLLMQSKVPNTLTLLVFGT